jgi:hypothetical protein
MKVIDDLIQSIESREFVNFVLQTYRATRSQRVIGSLMFRCLSLSGQRLFIFNTTTSRRVTPYGQFNKYPHLNSIINIKLSLSGDIFPFNTTE